MTQRMLTIGPKRIQISNDLPFVLFGGINVLESKELAFEVADHFVKITKKLKIPYVFKASFDKANRSSIKGYRGPGLDKGLQLLADIKEKYNIPVITDIHEIDQAKPASEIADVLQVPAFLSRQTDLVAAIAKMGKPINIKKAQFLAPHEMKNIIQKCEEAGNHQVILCERGTCFGYNNLVVDMLAFPIMKTFEYPVIFDVTHSLQLPGGRSTSADGRGQFVFDLARAGISQKIAGLFLETHPNPDQAQCDGPSALPLRELESFLKQLVAIDQVVKN